MADFSDEQRKSYWRSNVGLVTILVLGFTAAYVVAALWTGWLNQFSFPGLPIEYYKAAQLSVAFFIAGTGWYASPARQKGIHYRVTFIRQLPNEFRQSILRGESYGH